MAIAATTIWEVEVGGNDGNAGGFNPANANMASDLAATVATGIELWKVAIEALQGTLVTIVNDHGVSFYRCLVSNVSPLRTTPAMAPGGITQRGELTVSGVVT